MGTLFSVRKKLLSFKDLYRELYRAKQHYRDNIIFLGMRFLRLYLIDEFSRNEIFRYGLISPNLSPDERKAYLSKKKSLRIRNVLNPRSHMQLVEDKVEFYRYCNRLGIPTPHTYAIVTPAQVITFDGQLLETASQWESMLQDEIKSEFIAKPAKGVYGRGFDIFRRVDGGFLNTQGMIFSAQDLRIRFATDCRYDSYILQERIYNHPDIRRFSGTGGLQTVRFNTFITDSGEVDLLFYMMKMISGNNLTDNFDTGNTGNMIAVGEKTCGQLLYAFTLDTSGYGMHRIDRHPVSGRTFRDFEIPYWASARELVMNLAPKFLPLRTIGWDVAITENGPKLLEGNIWWDPTNYAPELMCPAQWSILRSSAQ